MHEYHPTWLQKVLVIQIQGSSKVRGVEYVFTTQKSENII